MTCPYCGTENAAENITCTNCGRALLEPRISWQPEGQPKQSLPLNRTLSIGRVAGNDIVIPDNALSRQHARVVVTEEGISVLDLGSLNGTFVNGERIHDERFLADGDVIRVGRTELTVSLEPVAPPAHEEAPESEATVALDVSGDVLRPATERQEAATVLFEPEAVSPRPEAASVAEGARPEAEIEPEREAAAGARADGGLGPGESPPAPTDEAEGATVFMPPTPEESAAALAQETSAERTSISSGEETVLAPLPSTTEPPSWAASEPAVAGYLVAGDVRAPILTELTVGRAEGNDIRVEGDRLVSRTHARIESRADGVWVVDLQSANGTFVNDRQVTDPVLLTDGDIVRFGATAFTFEAAVPASAPTPRPTPAPVLEPRPAPTPDRGGTDILPAVTDEDSGATVDISPEALAELQGAERAAPVPEPATGNLADQYHLVVNFGPETGHAFPLTRETTIIGRASPEANYDIQLNDRAVSRPHAKLVREGDGFTVYDLDSANGTWVNYTEEISGPRQLKDGDVVKVGKTTLIYRVPASARPAQGDVVLDPTAGQILTVFSLKGGVGTTAIAVNLAVAFRQVSQQSVLLIDLSTERAAVTVHMNLTPRATLADLPQDPGAIDWDVIQPVIVHHSSGVDVLPAPPSPQTAELVTAAAVSAILPLARARYKWVIIDTSSTFSELNLGVFDQSDLILLPVAPDMTSLRVMISTLDVFAALQTPAERRLLIFNQTRQRPSIGQTEIEEHLGERIGLALPYAEDAILDSIDNGVPIAVTNPTHPYVEAIRAFAGRLAQVQVQAVEQPKRGGFGSWVQGLIGSLRH